MKNMFAFTMAALVAAGAAFGGDHGFLRKGDTWVMSGDSITYIGLYAQTVRDAIEHFHPGSGIRVVNVGVWGQLAKEAKGKGLEVHPDVVSIMLGMNNVIHHDYPAKFDFTEGAKKYAETIRKQVKEYQASGAAVVLMKPTLTDETENSYFSPFHTREGLIVYGEALERMAAGEENVILEKGKAFVFTPPIPAVALPAKLGRIARVFMSVTPADGCPRLVCVLALLNEYERMDKDERRMTPCASETVSRLAVQLGSFKEARSPC